MSTGVVHEDLATYSNDIEKVIGWNRFQRLNVQPLLTRLHGCHEPLPVERSLNVVPRLLTFYATVRRPAVTCCCVLCVCLVQGQVE
jgi:hypothetical protein